MPVAFVGAAIAVAGAVAGGIEQSNMSEYQAKVAKENQQIANQNATYAQQAGQVEAFNKALVSRGQGGKLKANQAAQGIDVNTGSAVDVQKSQREVGLQDVAQTVANANRTAYGYRAQGVGYNAQAGLDTAAAGNELAGGFLSGASKAFGFAGSGDAPSWLWSGSTGGSAGGAGP